ncbi:MAG TPA: TetR/AcrR family transcriptional regulator [Gammaproteobacteria bacterium]
MARRSDHTKEQIKEMALSAAEKLVTRDGLQGLSARKIAHEIGYTVGTLYLVFENIDELISHVNARTLDMLYESLLAATVSCRQPRTCILAIGRAYVEFATRHPHRWKMIFEHNLAKGVEAPQWYRMKVNRMFELVEQQLQPLLAGQSRKKIAQTAKTLWCGVHGICALAVTNKLEVDDAQSIQTLTDSLINHFVAGIAADIPV